MDRLNVLLPNGFGASLDNVLKARISAHSEDRLLPFSESLSLSSFENHANHLFVSGKFCLPVILSYSFGLFSRASSELVAPYLDLVLDLLTLLVADGTVVDLDRGVELVLLSDSYLIVLVK